MIQRRKQDDGDDFVSKFLSKKKKIESKSKDWISMLPAEILRLIKNYLGFKTIKTCRLVNSNWRKLFDGSALRLHCIPSANVRSCNFSSFLKLQTLICHKSLNSKESMTLLPLPIAHLGLLFDFKINLEILTALTQLRSLVIRIVESKKQNFDLPALPLKSFTVEYSGVGFESVQLSQNFSIGKFTQLETLAINDIKLQDSQICQLVKLPFLTSLSLTVPKLNLLILTQLTTLTMLSLKFLTAETLTLLPTTLGHLRHSGYRLHLMSELPSLQSFSTAEPMFDWGLVSSIRQLTATCFVDAPEFLLLTQITKLHVQPKPSSSNIGYLTNLRALTVIESNQYWWLPKLSCLEELCTINKTNPDAESFVIRAVSEFQSLTKLGTTYFYSTMTTNFLTKVTTLSVLEIQTPRIQTEEETNAQINIVKTRLGLSPFWSPSSPGITFKK